ncbi:MAG: hypothetical protein MUF19_01425 [Candidatus Pacebacteria bacterium]|jgi:hypothetical protein|nr:hypothetical protein [Candidatus Paceibacterota bacterium]
MAHNKDQQHLLWFLQENTQKSHVIRIGFGLARATVVLRRPTQFPGHLMISSSVQVEKLTRQAVEWLEAYVKLVAKDQVEYSLEQSEHDPHIYLVCRKGSFVEADYKTAEDLAVAVVKFSVELLFYLCGLVHESYTWRKHFGEDVTPTPEAVYQWLGGKDGLCALRK